MEIKRVRFILSQTWKSTVESIEEDLLAAAMEWAKITTSTASTATSAQALYTLEVLNEAGSLDNLLSSIQVAEKDTPSSILSEIASMRDFQFVLRFANAAHPMFGSLDDFNKSQIYKAALVHSVKYYSMIAVEKGKQTATNKNNHLTPYLNIGLKYLDDLKKKLNHLCLEDEDWKKVAHYCQNHPRAPLSDDVQEQMASDTKNRTNRSCTISKNITQLTKFSSL
jgi:hypothetical protein